MDMAASDERLKNASAAEVDMSPLLGSWTNSNPQTELIKRFTLGKKGRAFTIHAYGAAAPFDWGETEVVPYMDNIGELAFHAIYDLKTVHSLLAANTNKGLIIIAAFNRFKNGSERSNFLCREFYFREM
jgi:hypothetical protein